MAVADSVVSVIVEKLVDSIIGEAVFLCGVRDQVQMMQIELKLMQSFLQDADAKQEEEKRVRTWVAEIRDAAYEAEDVIDQFILRVASKRRGGIQGLLKRYACIFNECINLHMTSKEIEAINTKIHNLSKSRETYGIKSIGQGEGTSTSADERQQRVDERQRLLRRSYSHVEDEDIIGLEKDIKDLVEELFKEEERLCVVSIVGMGGQGKTTLANKVYNHDAVKRHFDCCAWAFISQQCRTSDVLQEILKKVGAPTDQKMEIIRKMKVEELVKELYQFLGEKRYLVVLDDIWSEDDWKILVHAFPKGKMGSKILLTTRNMEVASHADPQSHHFEPPYLTEDQSWALLRKKAFRVTNYSPDLEKLGREMVRKCGGLPLAVAVLGGLLATKMSLNEWNIVDQSINSYLSKTQDKVLGILALSYNDLPYHLKPSLLYLGLFPEDFEIRTNKLIQLWIAEGFIRREGQETMEEVGEQYLDELINRCMVQIGKRSFTGRVKTCRVHDLMRDLCISKAKDENFLHIFHPENIASCSSLVHSAKLRRHAIHFEHERYVSLKHSTPHLRTLTFFNISRDLSPISLKFIYQDFKLLRVLDIDGGFSNTIISPREVGKLIHLRYLGLRGTGISRLPSSIGNLRSLLTLDLWRCHGPYKIPNVVWKMEQLRNLRLRAGSWIEEDLAKLTNLQKLRIYWMSTSQVEVVLNSIVVKTDSLLRSLHLEMETAVNNSFPNMEPLSRCQPLRKLYLYGAIEKLFPRPPNLTKLTLVCSFLEEDPMATLQNLQNLMFLRLLSYSYSGKEMVCSAQGFPQLQFLEVQTLDELEDWRVEEGAMPSLRRLLIRNCSRLRMLPEGLRFLTTLRELNIESMPLNFKDRVRKNGGEDRCKVQHIPSITIDDERVK